ncbi:stabilizer of axonemal microtubules 1-like [Hydractinia symbiolongicarpus]|uniref:stabilizer of axonemal microtubules 1-like n=1 Tax=Hydractinia symbiolongicarpus TaxID=13093 RepID=UPI00255122B1|nr:stabilizer of axonemal microtubules 1-like [Hydractinia symbiolongicarpus]
MKCICQICRCGKHRCPHYMPTRPQVTNKGPCALSEYQEGYKTSKGERIIVNRPQDNLKHDGDGDYITSHKENFHAHEHQPRVDHRPTEQYVKREEPMDLSTEYGTKYLKGKGEVAPLPQYFKKKTQPFGNEEELKGKSVTHEDYENKGLNPRPHLYKLRDNHTLSNAPMDEKSTHQADYQGLYGDRSHIVPRRADNLDGKGPGQFETTHHEHFVKHTQRPRSSKGWKTEYIPNNQPFSGQSMVQTDYKHHKNASKSHPVKYDNGLFNSDQQLDDETTHGATYKHWQVQRNVAKRDQDVYRPPSAAMDMQKTSDDYKNFGRRGAAKSLRPKTNVNFGDEFDGVTSYADGYVKHQISPRHKTQRSRDYYSSNVPFDSTTESKDNYKKQNVAPAQMIKREHEIFDTKKPFANKTSYGEQFESKKLPECPSSKIVMNNFAGYDLIDDFINGHRFLIKNGEVSTASSFRGDTPPLPPIGGGKNTTEVYVKV